MSAWADPAADPSPRLTRTAGPRSAPASARLVVALGVGLAFGAAGLLTPWATLAEETPAGSRGGLTIRARLVEADGEGTRKVGTPFVLEVVAAHAPGRVALLPDSLDLPATLGERRRARSHERALEEGRELDRYRLEIVPFEAGILEIPPIPLALGSTVSETEPILVEVASSLDEAALSVASSTRAENLQVLENMAAGDPAPESVRVPDLRPALGLLALAAAGLMAVFGFQLLKRRRPGASALERSPPPRPAHEVALARLEALDRSGLAERGEFNPYYTELSQVLRAYLGGRYGFDALERTRDELLEALEQMSTPGLDRVALGAFLAEADEIKFAKYRPRPNAAGEALEWARRLVEATRYDAAPGASTPRPVDGSARAPSGPEHEPGAPGPTGDPARASARPSGEAP